MELPSYFKDFLNAIRPSANQKADYKAGHHTLRQRLWDHETVAPAIVSTFLQGSYRRATAVRPTGETRPDVDVIVVTKLSKEELTPDEALGKFVQFLNKHYEGKWRQQGRSFAIELSYVDLDLVITAAPTQSEIGILKSQAVTSEDTPDDVADWKLTKSWISSMNRSSPNASLLMETASKETEWQPFPLWIPDRDTRSWEETHPLEQIKWTWAKNSRCNGHYVNIVKALKWWRKVKFPANKYPKGYPLEHVIGLFCPDGINSVAEGITRTLESLTESLGSYAASKVVPTIPGHGVPNQNVLARLSLEDFCTFCQQAKEAAILARTALNEEDKHSSIEAWRELLGDRFPPFPSGGTKKGGPDSDSGYTPRTSVSEVGNKRFASE